MIIVDRFYLMITFNMYIQFIIKRKFSIAESTRKDDKKCDNKINVSIHNLDIKLLRVFVVKSEMSIVFLI